MFSSARSILATAAATVSVLALGVAVPQSARADARPDCRNESVASTVEESRLTRTLGANPQPVPAQILDRSGFDVVAHSFAQALCSTGSPVAAGALIDRFGRRLWETAVHRAQQDTRGRSDLPGDDDRPLYWARLTMTLALRQWTPRFSLSATSRAELERRLEYASRRGAVPDSAGRASGPDHC